jgi:succinate--hydroxymethylglutarate CoA-transferase
VPYRSFKTADGDILLGGGNDRLWGILATKLGHPEWITDARFTSNALRVENREVLEALIERETAAHTTKHWLDAFEGSGMPYAAVNDIQGTLNHEHVLARGMVQQVSHPECGDMKLVNTPVKWSDADGVGIRSPPPTLGQHTDEVLAAVGYGPSRIQELKKGGTVS